MFSEKYGPWALIAGGSDGIGAAFARELAARGLNLLLIARSSARLDALSAEIRTADPAIEVHALALDLSADEAFDRVKAASADIEIGCLIYNVGAEPCYGEFLNHEWDFVRGRLNRNFVVKTALTHHFGRQMRARKRGGIVLMGSMSGFFGNPGFALYSASKAFTRYLAEGLWYELKKDNVDVLCPIVGPTDTPTMVNAYGRLENAMHPATVATSALAKLGEGPIWIADDIAEQIATISAMAPERRAALTAQWAEDFALKGKSPGSSDPR